MYVSFAPTAIAGSAVVALGLSQIPDESPQTLTNTGVHVAQSGAHGAAVGTRLASAGANSLPMGIISLAIVLLGLLLVAFAAHRSRT